MVYDMLLSSTSLNFPFNVETYNSIIEMQILPTKLLQLLLFDLNATHTCKIISKDVLLYLIDNIIPNSFYVHFYLRSERTFILVNFQTQALSLNLKMVVV